MSSKPYQKHPCSIVWTPILGLSWMLPFIGHVGITDSAGNIYDFQGDGMIVRNQMLFGWPTRYWTVKEAIQNEEAMQKWDEGLMNAKSKYEKQYYNFVTNNCHNFVCDAVGSQFDHWTVVHVGWNLWWYGKHVSLGRALYQWVPVLILYGLVAILFISAIVTSIGISTRS